MPQTHFLSHSFAGLQSGYPPPSARVLSGSPHLPESLKRQVQGLRHFVFLLRRLLFHYMLVLSLCRLNFHSVLLLWLSLCLSVVFSRPTPPTLHFALCLRRLCACSVFVSVLAFVRRCLRRFVFLCLHSRSQTLPLEPCGPIPISPCEIIQRLFRIVPYETRARAVFSISSNNSSIAQQGVNFIVERGSSPRPLQSSCAPFLISSKTFQCEF